MDVPMRDQLAYKWGVYSSAENNCLPACLSMIWEYLTGEYINPDQIHDQITVGPNGEPGGHGDTHAGYMTAKQGGWWIENIGLKRWKYRYGQGDAEYITSLKELINAGRPVIVLIVANREKMSGGHFVVLRSYFSSEGVTYFRVNNPYRGVYEVFSASRLLYLARPKNKWWLVVDEARSVPKFRTYAESWTATTASAVKMRREPFTDKEVVAVVPEGVTLRLTNYTDEGTAVTSSVPDRRWHYTTYGGHSGWLFDGGLDQSSFRRV